MCWIRLITDIVKFAEGVRPTTTGLVEVNSLLIRRSSTWYMSEHEGIRK